MPVLCALRRFFHPGRQRLLVAFSGGPDSLCLLWGLQRIAAELRLEILAAHVDHGLDSDSPRRAAGAAELAERLGIALAPSRLAGGPPTGESAEAWARRHRYRELDRLAGEHRADAVVTAHHAEDQAETVLLRMLYGSGIEGLAAIRATASREGCRPVVRPLLGIRRQLILATLQDTGLEPMIDPTNAVLRTPRNRIRHQLLPRLSAGDPLLVERLGALAKAAAAASRRSDRMLTTALSVRRLTEAQHPGGGAELDRRAAETLPEPLIGAALAVLGRRAGAPYPAGAPARQELLRQLRESRRVGCDCGHGWRFEGDRESLRLVRPKPKMAKFAYTLTIPGEVAIPELGLRARLRRGKVASWMFRGRVDRAGLAVELSPGNRVEIRNRRPGDRIQPLGSTERLRVKDLLIARKVPRARRDHLPLMVIDGTIAWIPGITIDERFRLRSEETAWIAEIEPLNDSTVEL